MLLHTDARRTTKLDLDPSRLLELRPRKGQLASRTRRTAVVPIGQDEHVTWLHATLYDAARAAYQEAADLAEWSAWLPFEDARRAAPREPGVYLLREPTGQIRYAGMAGERAGSGRPQGLYGRLSAYWSGKGAVSGFGEAALARPGAGRPRLGGTAAGTIADVQAEAGEGMGS
jgi:hypothetical protein